MTSAARRELPELPRVARMLGAKPMRELRSGIRFAETMRGQIAMRATDPSAGYADHAAMGAVLHAAVRLPNLDAFLADPHHKGWWTAELDVPMLGGRFTDTDGDFHLFRRVIDGHTPVREMVYDATLSGAGGQYTMVGRKVIEPGPPWRAWPATTTLNVKLLDTNGTTVASGQLKLSVLAFVLQLLSIRVTGSASALEKPGVTKRFMKFFAGALVRSYLLGRRW